MSYLFQSERLGFRNWKQSDLKPFQEMNASEDVMQYFPKTLTPTESDKLVERMQHAFEQTGFCYFAVEILKTKEFIGFIGLMKKELEPFGKMVDIGWRLKPSAWGKGFATEGSKKCLDFAFNDLKLDKIHSIATKVNTPSISVMKKIGMHEIQTFDHHLMLDNERLKTCVLYLVERYVRNCTENDFRRKQRIIK
jgi:RimJ/RimL family protein N-acetyltransferase